MTTQVNAVEMFTKSVSIVKTLASDPKNGWQTVKNEYGNTQDVFFYFLAPLILLAAICQFIKFSIIGFNVPVLGPQRLGIIEGFTSSFFHVVAQILSIGVGAYIADALAPKFGGQSNYLNTVRWLAFSAGLGLLASVLVFIPFLGTLASLVAGLYGLYILYQGTTEMTGVPLEKRLVYVIVCFVVMVVLSFVLSAVFGTIAHFA